MSQRKDGAARLLAGLTFGVACGVAIGRRWKRGRFSFRNRTVLITGGSRGLGLVMARQLASKGANLAIVARDRRELERAADYLSTMGAQVLSLPCDIRNQSQVEDAVEKTVDRFGRLDVVVNNAGIIQVGPMDQMTMVDFEDALAVHFFGPLHFTLAALPYMRRQGGGRIVNISSVGGKIAVPHLLPYAASKFALTGLSEGLRAELKRENILVTTVCPGLMRTGSPRNALFKGRHRQEYAWFAVSDSLPLLSTCAERAARKIIEATRRGSPRLIIGMHIKAAVLLSEIFPGASAALLSLGNRLLPGPDPSSGDKAWRGAESESRLAPKWLTRLSHTAARRNNEMESGG